MRNRSPVRNSKSSGDGFLTLGGSPAHLAQNRARAVFDEHGCGSGECCYLIEARDGHARHSRSSSILEFCAPRNFIFRLDVLACPLIREGMSWYRDLPDWRKDPPVSDAPPYALTHRHCTRTCPEEIPKNPSTRNSNNKQCLQLKPGPRCNLTARKHGRIPSFSREE